MARHRRARSASQPWLIPTAVLLVVLPIAGGILTAVRSDSTAGPPQLSREGSTRIAGPDARPLPIGGEPGAYSIIYRVERYDPSRVVVSTDRLDVRRPFDSRVVGERGGHTVSERVSRLGAIVLSTGQGARSIVAPPAAASGDLRLSPVLADAVESGALERREQRRVIGRRCQVFRAGGPIAAGDLVPVGTKAGEHADFCVDESGLVLEDVWYQGGRAIQRRVAEKLDTTVSFDATHFVLANEEPYSRELGNGFIRRVDPASGFEGTSYRLAADPAGFSFVGRFLVQPPNLSLYRNVLEEGERPPEQISLVDVWQRGIDIVVLAQTIATDIAAVPPSSPTARRFVLGPAGEAAAVLDLRMNEIRADLPEGRFLRLGGTLTRAALAEIASTLRAEEATGPVVID
ncbi:MAG TPA: hypothetical protein VM345_00840 [Acidimicrobiales bacterium]|jgi:hypothetical protein|nr:hypothetical protein [Acidimicrobiales bacterium]